MNENAYTIPQWLIDEGFEPGDDPAEFDAFFCESCGALHGKEDSIVVSGESGHELHCLQCH